MATLKTYNHNFIVIKIPLCTQLSQSLGMVMSEVKKIIIATNKGEENIKQGEKQRFEGDVCVR